MQITTTNSRMHALVLNDDELATIEQALNDLTTNTADVPVAWALWRTLSDVIVGLDIESGAR